MNKGYKAAFENPRKLAVSGAPGATRTPDPQIRSLYTEGMDFNLKSTIYGAELVPVSRYSYTQITAVYLGAYPERGTV